MYPISLPENQERKKSRYKIFVIVSYMHEPQCNLVDAKVHRHM